MTAALTLVAYFWKIWELIVGQWHGANHKKMVLAAPESRRWLRRLFQRLRLGRRLESVSRVLEAGSGESSGLLKLETDRSKCNIKVASQLIQVCWVFFPLSATLEVNLKTQLQIVVYFENIQLPYTIEVQRRVSRHSLCISAPIYSSGCRLSWLNDPFLTHFNTGGIIH